MAKTTDAGVETPQAEHHHHHDHDHSHEFEFVADPSFDVQYKGECVYEVGVTIPAANRKAKADEMFDELQGGAQLPGFRRGKAPKALVQSKFARAVRSDVFQSLVSSAFEKLIHDNELRPLGMPDIDGVEAALESGEDTDIAITFKFEVAPRVTLGDYTGLKVERPVLEVEDADIDRAIDELRERTAYFVSVEEAPSQEGDQVVIDFTGRIDGEVFAGGSAENYPYFIGSKRFFPQFEAALVGANVGQEVTAEVPFPEDYHGKDVAGKTAIFTIKINEIKRRALPELDEDFAREAGYESIADMREKVAADLRAGASQQSQQIMENRLLKQVVENSTYEIPASLIESSTQEYYRQELQRLAQLRISPAEVQKRAPEILEEARQAAVDNIKAFVTINEIGLAEGISVTEEDFAQEAAAIQARTGMNLDVVQRFLSQADQRSDYEGRIFRRKAMQIVANAAEIKDVVVTREEMDKEEESILDEEE
jgi:trigger factor